MSEQVDAPATALIRVLWVPARREPDHRAEMVTQWLCGERVETLESRSGWILARGADGYAAWIPESATTLDPEDGWLRSAAWSLGAHIAWPDGHGAYLPWGARVRQLGEELWLPDGQRATAVDPDAIVPVEELSRRCPRDADSVVATARTWTHVPYVWGGRTDTGCDCSGFVQAVFAAHGLPLPRDSRDQAEVGDRVAPVDMSVGGVDPADLLFFAPEQAGITHVAIASGGTRILHCSSMRGRVSEDDLAADGALEELLRESVVCATKFVHSSPAAEVSDALVRPAASRNRS